ncbi:hypothetical protein SAMN05216436_10994 [bacterium A37T11]|nr:hypothetical protein SAMN05216436_10994 [bacterium A37T11]
MNCHMDIRMELMATHITKINFKDFKTETRHAWSLLFLMVDFA